MSSWYKYETYNQSTLEVNHRACPLLTLSPDWSKAMVRNKRAERNTLFGSKIRSHELASHPGYIPAPVVPLGQKEDLSRFYLEPYNIGYPIRKGFKSNIFRKLNEPLITKIWLRI